VICRVKRIWEGEKRVTVILVEEGQIKETQAFLWMPEQQLQAALCLQVEKQWGRATCPLFVVQLAPAERFSGHHIETLEMIHEPASDAELDAALDAIDRDIRAELEPQGTLADVQMEMDRAHGKDWKDI